MPKPTKAHALTLKPSVAMPAPRLVQAESETMEMWLRQTAMRRAHRPLIDRLDALLWSFPIRLGFSTRPQTPLWPSTVDTKEVRRRKAGILTRLTRLAWTVYSETVYPETSYFDTWAPHDWPSTMDDADFKAMSHDLCEELRTLPGVTVPNPHNDRRWLIALLEYGWGDGRVNERREYQNSVVNSLPEPVRLKVCTIAEEARDAAYLEVRKHRCLDALHHTKEQAQAFREWLLEEKTHAPFFKEHLTERHSSEFHRAVERMTKALDFYMANASEGRSRRATAGQQPRPWVDQARRALKALHLSELHRRDLLIAWSLTPFPRAL